jgi:hypothetical protein
VAPRLSLRTMTRSAGGDARFFAREQSLAHRLAPRSLLSRTRRSGGAMGPIPAVAVGSAGGSSLAWREQRRATLGAELDDGRPGPLVDAQGEHVRTRVVADDVEVVLGLRDPVDVEIGT